MQALVKMKKAASCNCDTNSGPSMHACNITIIYKDGAGVVVVCCCLCHFLSINHLKGCLSYHP